MRRAGTALCRRFHGANPSLSLLPTHPSRETASLYGFLHLCDSIARAFPHTARPQTGAVSRFGAVCGLCSVTFSHSVSLLCVCLQRFPVIMASEPSPAPRTPVTATVHTSTVTTSGRRVSSVVGYAASKSRQDVTLLSLSFSLLFSSGDLFSLFSALCLCLFLCLCLCDSVVVARYTDRALKQIFRAYSENNKIRACRR